MRETKTAWFIVWADGKTEMIRRRSNGWHWSGGPNGTPGMAVSSHLFNVQGTVADFGGTMERRPNTNYRAPRAFTFINL